MSFLNSKHLSACPSTIFFCFSPEFFFLLQQYTWYIFKGITRLHLPPSIYSLLICFLVSFSSVFLPAVFPTRGKIFSLYCIYCCLLLHHPCYCCYFSISSPQICLLDIILVPPLFLSPFSSPYSEIEKRG